MKTLSPEATWRYYKKVKKAGIKTGIMKFFDPVTASIKQRREALHCFVGKTI